MSLFQGVSQLALDYNRFVIEYRICFARLLGLGVYFALSALLPAAPGLHPMLLKYSYIPYTVDYCTISKPALQYTQNIKYSTVIILYIPSGSRRGLSTINSYDLVLSKLLFPQRIPFFFRWTKRGVPLAPLCFPTEIWSTSDECANIKRHQRTRDTRTSFGAPETSRDLT